MKTKLSDLDLGGHDDDSQSSFRVILSLVSRDCPLMLSRFSATRPYIIRHEEANHHHSFHHDMEASPNYQIRGTSSDLLLLQTNNDEECSDQETDIALTLPRATIDDMINVQIQRWLRTALQLFLC
ncbi:hypothetical protein DY000_02023539 [Brassica cretica]|uniref:Uncharacterized protein n=1 Tax=Brassica cretica TaxID=69181 RepID=A0ABQ7EJY4_BRACR|nr:hypothetical protein DY000_02023539 [Brassica cretica]